ncbi:MAG: 1-aminocyclopropane-1-carboxylate deaminase/D-cysteine desulfhydrase, partial [Bacteroidota bacterium]
MINFAKIHKLNDSEFSKRLVSVFILDLEKIHPSINGNKYFKLKYNIEEFFHSDKKQVLTFGGAYSNHIYATAAAGKEFGFETIGIIRGEELNTESN